MESTKILNVVDTRVYDNITEADLKLKYDYAKSIVSNLSGIDTRRLTLDDRRVTFNESTLTENFRVMYNQRSWGRIAISVTRLTTIRLQFVAMKRGYHK